MTTPLPRPKRKKKGEGGGSGTLRADREKAGLTASQDIHALPPEDGELLELDPETISPNPMNMRLELRDMDSMIADVGERDVHTPGIVMHTKVFMKCYPQWASRVKHPDRTFILGPGHRRHAAALATGHVMPAVLRDDSGLSPRCFSRCHTVAEQSRTPAVRPTTSASSTPTPRLVVVVGRSLPGSRNGCRAWTRSAKEAVGTTMTIADGGYPGTGLVMPHRRNVPDWKQHNRHQHVRARVERAFARMKGWKILRDCRFKADGVHHAMLGIARLYNLTLMG